MRRQRRQQLAILHPADGEARRPRHRCEAFRRQQARAIGPDVLARLEFPIGEDDAGQSLIAHLAASVESEASWTKEHPYILENPPLPESATEVQLLGTCRVAESS